MELDKIYNMDAFEGMKQIPDKSINLAIIDPPYNIGVTTQVNGMDAYVACRGVACSR